MGTPEWKERGPLQWNTRPGEPLKATCQVRGASVERHVILGLLLFRTRASSASALFSSIVLLPEFRSPLQSALNRSTSTPHRVALLTFLRALLFKAEFEEDRFRNDRIPSKFGEVQITL